MAKNKQQLFQIGEIAHACGVTRRAILHYESKGLFSPTLVNAESGYRYYTSRDLSILTQIVKLKDAGLSLDEIGDYMSGESGMGEQIERLMAQKARLENGIAELRSRNIRRNEYPVEWCELPRRVCFERRFFCHGVDEAIPYAVSTVDEAISLGLQFSVNWDCFCEYPDSGVFSGEIELNGFEMNVCVPLESEPFPEGCVCYPASRAIRTYHRGAYEYIGAAYQALKDFLDTHAIQPCGAAQEIYLEGEAEHDDHTDCYITQIILPVSDCRHPRQSPPL